MEHSWKGFSFIELMLGVFIVAAVSILALPSLMRADQTYKLVAATNNVRSRLHYARIQAVNRNVDHRIRVTNPSSYVLERRSGLSWQLVETYTIAIGFSISASGTAEFHSRGNANPVTGFTITNARSDTRLVAVETSGYIHE